MINIWISRIRSLTTGINCSIRNSKESEFLLKYYIKNRFNMSATDIAGLFTNLCRQSVNGEDARMVNLRKSVQRNYQGFEMPDKIRIAWALTKMKDRELAYKIIESVKSRIDELTINQLSTILWILAKTESKDVKLFIKITKRIKSLLYDPSTKLVTTQQRNMHQYNALSIVQTLWSVSSMNFSDKQLFDAIVKNIIMQRPQQFNSRMLIITMYSCVKTKYKKKYPERLYQLIKKRKDNLKDQSVLTLKLLIETCAKIKTYDRQFIEQLVYLVINKHSGKAEMSSKFSSQILKALIGAQAASPECVRLLMDTFMKRLPQAKEIDCIMVLRVISQEPWKNEYESQIKIVSTKVNGIPKNKNRQEKQEMPEDEQ